MYILEIRGFDLSILRDSNAIKQIISFAQAPRRQKDACNYKWRMGTHILLRYYAPKMLNKEDSQNIIRGIYPYNGGKIYNNILLKQR